MKTDVVQFSAAEERAMIAQQVAVPVGEDGRIVEGAQPRETSGMSTSNIQKLSKLTGLDRRMKIMGVAPATILNMNPYQLQINSTLMGDIIVPACEPGKPYSVLVIRDYRVTWQETEDSANPTPWVPVHMASEFERQYYNNGGVVVYQGDGLRENPEEFMAKNPAIKRNFDEARTRQIKYAEDMVRQATAEWNTPNRSGARNINNIHRSCALLLHDVRGQELPPWMEKIPGQYGLGNQCPVCKAIPQSGAVLCPNCTFVLDPKTAFEMGLIQIDDTALTRLERKTLEEMGISEHVSETVVERTARLKAEAAAKRAEKGKPEAKPKAEPKAAKAGS